MSGLLASDVLSEMERIVNEHPGACYVGDYAEEGRYIWPERWDMLRKWLYRGIRERSEATVDSVDAMLAESERQNRAAGTFPQ